MIVPLRREPLQNIAAAPVKIVSIVGQLFSLSTERSNVDQSGTPSSAKVNVKSWLREASFAAVYFRFAVESGRSVNSVDI